MLILDFKGSPAFHLDLAENWAGLLVALIILALFDVFLFTVFRRVLPRLFLILLEVGMVMCWLFGLTLPLIALGICTLSAIVFFFIANRNDSRELVANNMVGRAASRSVFRRKKIVPEVLFDREEVNAKITAAVLWMSEQKIGAIITMEKKNDLTDVCHNGTILNAPVSTELLQTIFYKGTRLHDGAVIIRNGTIVAAAVAFQPTIRPMDGKYGLRHRAAIGISEHYDCVTIVVSEETGRISITHQGNIEHISPRDFSDRLADYMSPSRDMENED
ncbi:MAG: DNA integrity scanning protein DisA nucleotide-binding domain protein [Bacilli bacterium]|nr:DNA integrity scanning protein DisA nucleotide-binding domain protein [Bacilli bacterium]